MADTPTSLLQQLQLAEEKANASESGLDLFNGLRIAKPEEYLTLSPDQCKRLKDRNPLAATLPKPPTLGAAAFLLNRKTAGDLREQFEDGWTASSLTYACAANVFRLIAQRVQEGAIADNDELIAASRDLVLAASNTPARQLEVYKYIATKAALKATPKPGNSRDAVLNSEELKNIQTSLDTTHKIQRKLHGTKFPGTSFGNHNKRYTRPWRPKGRGRPFPYRGGGRRGRGRGRGGDQQ